MNTYVNIIVYISKDNYEDRATFQCTFVKDEPGPAPPMTIDSKQYYFFQHSSTNQIYILLSTTSNPYFKIDLFLGKSTLIEGHYLEFSFEFYEEGEEPKYINTTDMTLLKYYETYEKKTFIYKSQKSIAMNFIIAKQVNELENSDEYIQFEINIILLKKRKK